jgi:ribosomal protein L24E
MKPPAPQPPSAKLTARVCTFCGKGLGTFAYRQDGGAFFAHPRCMRRYQKIQRAKETK